MTYKEIQLALNIDAGIVVFFKSDGSKRVMLCTRNIAMASHFGGGNLGYPLECRDKKFEGTTNIPVVDLEITDLRAFNVEKVLLFENVGDIRNAEILDKAACRVKELREQIVNDEFSTDAINLL